MPKANRAIAPETMSGAATLAKTTTTNNNNTITASNNETTNTNSNKTMTTNDNKTMTGENNKLHYRRHVFVCENKRTDGECCADHKPALKLLRALMKEKNMHGTGGVRINRAGCLDRCAHGPVMVIYPEGAWYRYDNDDDVREIAASHLVNGKPVNRLLLPQSNDAAAVVEINLSGLRCPLPVLRVKKALTEMQPGETLRAFATDPGAAEDIPAFVRQAGHQLQGVAESNGGRFFTIVKK